LCRCIEALFDATVPRLLARLKEREESVKLDIFATLEDVLRTWWGFAIQGAVQVGSQLPHSLKPPGFPPLRL
jgi:hypothetical protein